MKPLATVPESAPSSPINVISIPLRKLKPSPTNPRKKFDPVEEEKMKNSMEAHGFTLSTILARRWPAEYFIDEKSAAAGKWFVCQKTKDNPDGRPVERGMVTTKAAADKMLEELTGCYEIVAGERRWRGANAAKLLEAPCIVAELSNAKVLELQLVENLQRTDLTPMEVAIGFGQLIALCDDAGKPLHNTKTMAESTGMHVTYVQRHLAVARIAGDPSLKEFFKAFEDGLIGLKHAYKVAIFPDMAQRAKLAKRILHPPHEEGPLSVARLEMLIREEYMIDMRAAPFDQEDAQLVPIEVDGNQQRVAGGACTDCPNRLGNRPDFFEDGKVPNSSANMCLHPACFELKRSTAWKKWQDKETDPAKKRRALSQSECYKIYPHGDQLAHDCDYVDMMDRPCGSDLKAGKESPGTWGKLTKGRELEVTVAKDRNGRVHELVDRALAITAAKVNKHDIFKEQKSQAGGAGFGGGGSGGTQMSLIDQARANQEAKDETEIATAEDRSIGKAIFEAAKKGKLPKGFWAAALETLAMDYGGDAPREMAERHLGDDAEYEEFIEAMGKMPEADQAAMLAEWLYWSWMDMGASGRFEKLFGIKGDAVRKEAAAATKKLQKERAELHVQIVQLMDRMKWKLKEWGNFRDKHAKACGLGKTDLLEHINHVPTLQFLLADLVKLAGPTFDEKQLAKARELRKAKKATNVPQLTSALKIDSRAAGQIHDTLVDEEAAALVAKEAKK